MKKNPSPLGLGGFYSKFECKIIDLCERKSSSLFSDCLGNFLERKDQSKYLGKGRKSVDLTLGHGRIFPTFRIKIFEFWMTGNLRSLLQQTGSFSESWIWTYFEPKIRAPLPKKESGFFEYPKQDIIWILNRENLGSLLQQTGRFSGTKFEPKIFKFWKKNRAPLVQGECLDF